jgi:hypothetical protein
MSLNRRNPRRDKTERLIIETLEARGFSVTQISGKGVPDLLVGKAWSAEMPTMWLVEVKDRKGKLTAAQVQWRERWTGPPPILLRTVEEAMKFPLAGVSQ